jgi:hypothetical protein
MMAPSSFLKAKVARYDKNNQRRTMKALEELMFSIRRVGEADNQPGLPGKPVDLLLYAPCPVKLGMKERIDRIITDFALRDTFLNIHIPMGCTSIDPYDPIYREEDADKLPAVIGSIGFGDF